MTKFLSVLSFILLSFGVFNISYAACGTINLTCTQDLELTWTSTGQDPTSCDVGGGNWNGSTQCNSGGWVRIPANLVPEGQSSYTFQGVPLVQPPASMSDTCTVVKPTNCSAGGSTPTISATTPQICSPATTGTSIISWQNMTPGESIGITVGSNTPPNYFATGGSVNGSQPAPWITLNPITFKLYRTTTGVPVFLDSIDVQGTTAGCPTGGTGYCGDNSVQAPNAAGVNEQCDDGNTVNGDGCSSTCQIQSTPSGFYCQTTTMCSACGGTSGVTCPATNVYQSGTCGGACPAGGTCGNGVQEGTEQCDQGAQNGQPSSTCSATCTTQTPTVPSADIGFDSTYTKNETITLATGQTTTNATLYLTSANIPSGSCDLQQFNVYGNGQWGSIHGGLARNISTTNLRSNLAVGEYTFRYSCTTTSGVTTRSNEAVLIVESAPAPTAIDIGWTDTYNPKSRTEIVASGGVTDLSLYVTTGGRAGCTLTGYMEATNQTGINPVPVVVSSYAVKAPQRANPYQYTLSCPGVTVSATLTVNSAAPGTPSVTCAPAPQTIPATFKFNWAASGFSNSGEVRCTEDGTLLAKGVVSGSFTRNAPGPYSVVCTKSPETASASCIAQAAPVCGNGIVEPPEECDGGANCSPTTCQHTGCGNGICTDSCPQNCTNDNSLCVGGQAFITSPANGRVLINNPFTVAFSFQNIGGTTWTNPTYQVSTTAGTFSSWRTVFGTRALSPTSIAGILGGSQSTNTYTQQFTAPGTAGTYPLAFTVIKTGTAFGDQCLVNSTGQVTVSVPQCNDNSDNDGDGKIDCGVTIKGVTYPADPGCFPNGNGGGGACNVNKDDETDNSGVNMGITANPQLVRQNGTSEVSFTCDASTWSVAGPQVGGITGVVRDTTTLGCTNANVFCGTGAQTNKVFPATNIQVKETYTLRCGGKERSATISVIKINEI